MAVRKINSRKLNEQRDNGTDTYEIVYYLEGFGSLTVNASSFEEAEALAHDEFNKSGIDLSSIDIINEEISSIKNWDTGESKDYI